MKQQLKKIFAMSMAITMSVTNLVSAADVVTVSQNALKAAPPQVTEENGITSIDVASILGTQPPAVSDNDMPVILTDTDKSASISQNTTEKKLSQNTVSQNKMPLRGYIGQNSFSNYADGVYSAVAMLVGDGMLYKDNNGKYYETPYKTDDTYYYWLDKEPTLKSEYKDIYYNTHLVLSELTQQSNGGFFAFGDGSGEYYLGTSEYSFSEGNDSYYGVCYLNRSGQSVPLIKLKSGEGFYSYIERINAGYNGVAATATLYGKYIGGNDYRNQIDVGYKYNQNAQKVYHEDGKYFSSACVTNDYLTVLDTTESPFKILVINPQTNQKIKEFEMDNSVLNISNTTTIGIFPFKDSNTVLLHANNQSKALKINLDTQQQTNISLPGSGSLLSNHDFSVYTSNYGDYYTKYHYSYSNYTMEMYEKNGLAISADQEKIFYAVWPYSNDHISGLNIIVNDMNAQTAFGYNSSDSLVIEPRIYASDPFATSPVAENISYFGTNENTVLPNVPKYWVFQNSYPYLNFNRPSASNCGYPSMEINTNTMFEGIVDNKINPYAAVNQFICTDSSASYAAYGIIMIKAESGAPDQQFIGAEGETCDDAIYHVDYTSIFDPSSANTMTDEEKQAALPIVQSRMEKIPGYHTHNNEVNTFFYESNTDGTVVDPGTCTTPKKTQINCAICGQPSIQEDTTDMHHDFLIPEQEYWWGYSYKLNQKVLVNATCRTPEVYTVACSKCGETIFTFDGFDFDEIDGLDEEGFYNYIEEHGHANENATLSDTDITNLSYYGFDASEHAFNIDMRKISPKHHSPFGQTYATEPTCTAPGVYDLHCQYCGKEVYNTNAEYYDGFDSYLDENSLNDGNENNDYVSITSEMRDGYTFNYKTGEYYKDMIAAPPLGHDYSEENIIKAASCTRTGVKESTCSRCGIKVRQTIPKTGHEFDVTTLVSPSTCTQQGIANVKCKHCGLILSRYRLPLEAHDFSVYDHYDSNTGNDCYVCSVCGKAQTDLTYGKKFYDTWDYNKQTSSQYEDNNSNWYDYSFYYDKYNYTDDNGKKHITAYQNSDIEDNAENFTNTNVSMQLSDLSVYSMNEDKMADVTIDGQSIDDFLGVSALPEKLQIKNKIWYISSYDGYTIELGQDNYDTYNRSWQIKDPVPDVELGMVEPFTSFTKEGCVPVQTRHSDDAPIENAVYEIVQNSQNTATEDIIYHPENWKYKQMYCIVNFSSLTEGHYILDTLPEPYALDTHGMYSINDPNYENTVRPQGALRQNPIYGQPKYYRLTATSDSDFTATETNTIDVQERKDNFYLISLPFAASLSENLNDYVKYGMFDQSSLLGCLNGGGYYTEGYSIATLRPFTGFAESTDITATTTIDKNGNSIDLDYDVTLPGREGYTGYRTGIVNTNNTDNISVSNEKIWFISKPTITPVVDNGDYFDYQYEDSSNIIAIPFTDYDAKQPIYEVYIVNGDEEQQINDEQIIGNTQFHFQNFIDYNGDGNSDLRGFSIYATTTKNIDETVQYDVKIVCRDGANLLTRPQETFYGALTIENIDAEVEIVPNSVSGNYAENILSVSGNTVTVLKGQPVTYSPAGKYIKSRIGEEMNLEATDTFEWYLLVNDEETGLETRYKIENQAGYLLGSKPSILTSIKNRLRTDPVIAGYIDADGNLTYKMTTDSAKLVAKLKGRYGEDEFVLQLLSSNPVTNISAQYVGNPIPVTQPGSYNSYAEDDVEIILTYADGSMRSTLDPADPRGHVTGTYTKIPYTEFTLTSKDHLTSPTTKQIRIIGNNTFNAKHNGTGLNADFIVQGVKTEVGLEAVYGGTPVPITQDYNKNDVEVRVVYSDGTKQVVPTTDWTESALTVNAVGDNSFTATYHGLTKPFTVPGTKVPDHITATYHGNDIKVGDNYKKQFDPLNPTDGVEVRLYYHDGSYDVVADTDWTANSITVASSGANNYVATYTPDPTKTANYTVNGFLTPVSMTATYNGPDILVGQDYDRADVTLVVTYHNGSTKTITDPTQWTSTPVSVTVPTAGDNNYTASYTENGATVTDGYTVPGVLNITGINAVYTGPAIEIGSNYAKADVTVTLTYHTGATRVLTVSEWNPSSLGPVTTVGANNFTAYYQGQPAKHEVVANKNAAYTVPGKLTATQLVAVYTGPAIQITGNYSKDDVHVYQIFTDLSTADVAKDNWEANSYSVTAVGGNNYTVTSGTMTAPLIVPGINEPDHITAVYDITKKVKTGLDFDKADCVVTLYYKNGDTTVIPAANWDSLPNQTVTAVGNNAFTARYVATYYTPAGNVNKTLTDDFTVVGYRDLLNLTAVYTGAPINVSESYAKADVTVTAIYHDGNVVLTPAQWANTPASLVITKDGANNFTASFEGKTAPYTVPGVKQLDSLSAVYAGPAIKVNTNYDKADVVVTAHYNDGSTKVLTPAEWTADSLLVTTVGNNNFTATYNTKTAGYIVPGKKTAVQIDAVYTGEPVTVGKDYDKDKVTVTVLYDDGSTTVLTSADWTESSLTITKVGPNNFTATYNTLVTTYSVPGKKSLVSISAVYAGPVIDVGKNYDKKDVTVIAKYDDKSFKVLDITEWTESGLKVTADGPNTFTATYNALKAEYKVPGKKVATKITAVYTGDAVNVGDNYDKEKVIVTVLYNDNSKDKLTTAAWKESSLKVIKDGPNTYTATYQTMKADYTVPGKKVATKIKASYKGKPIIVGKEYKKKEVTVTLYYNDGSSKKLTTAEWDESGLKVKKTGKNKFTATYKENTKLTATYKVKGENDLLRITAVYTGDKIKVGKNYNKSDVNVVAFYADGTKQNVASWEASSLKVTKTGDNTFTATYKSKKAQYKVPGYEETDKTTVTKKKVPKTGDETPIGLYVVLLIAAILGFFACKKHLTQIPAENAKEEQEETLPDEETASKEDTTAEEDQI